MKANEVNFLTLLDGTKQFVLPIYQRRYSWKRQDCQNLWDDIVNIGEHENLPYHFFGSIVSRSEGTPTKPQFFVIDGQQRLATFSLLLSALGRAIEKVNDLEIGTNKEKIEDKYLFNPHEGDEFHHKLLLTKPDRDILIQLLDGDKVSDNTSPLVKNYNFFTRKLKPGNLETVYKGIQKLMIVDIVLYSDADNPQLIFESLNSKGIELSAADLIRNYVLMVHERSFQKYLYEEYWLPMEQSFGAEHSKRFDLFIKDYLTLKTGKIPPQTKRGVYESFKGYMPDARQPQALEKKIDEIKRYSAHYIRIALRAENNPALCACLEDLHTLRVEVAYPILLGVYEASKQGKIEQAEIIEIFRLIESYVFRRVICNLRTASMNKNFALIARIMDSIFEFTPSETSHKNSYLDLLKRYLSSMDGIHRFPLDDEFKRDFLTRDVYEVPRARNYLLSKLENDGRKEPISVGGYTIERVMPETLTEDWQTELGENGIDTHERFLNTIGNLTLTGYNSELSNRSFKEKRDYKPGGFRDSPLWLNQSLAQVEQWNADAIIERAEMLSEKACKIWAYPTSE